MKETSRRPVSSGLAVSFLSGADTLQAMVEEAYDWAAEMKARSLSLHGHSKPMGVPATKYEAIRLALLIPGISQRGVADITGTSKATVARVVADMKVLAKSTAATA